MADLILSTSRRDSVLATAYLAIDEGDPRENARHAMHWHHEAQSLQLPLPFP